MLYQVFDRSNKAAVAKMEAFIKSHANGHFLQLPQWAAVKTSWDWRGIFVYRQGQPIAAASVLIRPLPLGFCMFYIPRGPVCDRNDRTVWAELMEALKHTAKKHRAIMLYTDPDEPDTNTDFRFIMQSLGFTEKTDEGFGNIQAQHVFRLSLTAHSKEELFEAFCPKTRYNIRLSSRKGIIVKDYSGVEDIPDDELEAFYSLMVTTGQRDHFYIRSPAYFKNLMHAMQEDAHLLIAYLEGQPIAGTIEAFCGRKAWYLYGASANSHRNAMPNYLLQWTMIQRALERSCVFYDFRGVPANPTADDPLYGLYRFKKGFSGTYTKFTGLFTYSFRPVLGKLLRLALRLRQCCTPCTRKPKKGT